MNIELCMYKGPPNSMQKEITVISTRTGQLVNGTGLVNPTILFDGNGSLANGNFNYMHIPDFGRYYFISEPTVQTNQLWSVTGHCDVLMSFKSQIGACYGITARQENQFNNYFMDYTFTGYQNPKNYYLKFPTGFIGEDFVLALAGNQN